MFAKLRRNTLAGIFAAGAAMAGLPAHAADQPPVQPVVVLVVPEQEQFYQVDDPQLGDAEPALVDAMLRALGRA